MRRFAGDANGDRGRGVSLAHAGLIGYAPGAFDMFHVGHLNILRRASLHCDYLVAGVVSDEVALQQKGRWPAVPQQERLEIVASMDFVDEAVMAWTTDKRHTWDSVKFDVIFKGDDWRESEKGRRLERDFAPLGVRVVYLPYTWHTSTTRLRAAVGTGSSCDDVIGSPVRQTRREPRVP